MVALRARIPAVQLHETQGGKTVSIILSLVSMAALSICLCRRVQNIKNWTRLPLLCWLILIIYCDSIAFVAGTAIVSYGYGVDTSKSICAEAILLCLGCYLTEKFIYYFLVERVYIIRGRTKPRLKNRLYLFNALGMLIPYCVVIVLNFKFRIALYEEGTCRIGMKQVAIIPLISFDVLVYLTCLFLIPLRALYSYRNSSTSQTRKVALRTFIGSCCTLISSVVNLTVLMVFEGEPGWICLMCCNVDVLFSVLVLHWITSEDNASTTSMSTANEVKAIPSPTPKPLIPSPPCLEGPLHELEFRNYTGTSRTRIGILPSMSRLREEDNLDRISNYPERDTSLHKREGMNERVLQVSDESSHTRMSDERRRERTGSMDDLC